jgi:hypothetical protein
MFRKVCKGLPSAALENFGAEAVHDLIRHIEYGVVI